MVVGQAQPELAVDLGLVGRVGLFQDGEQAAECVDQVLDLFAAQPLRPRCRAGPIETGPGRHVPVLDVAGPARDQGGIGSGFQRGTVLGELAVAGGDLAACRLGVRVGRGLGLRQHVQRGGQVLGVEGPGEPAVEGRQDGILAQVDVQRVVQAVGEGVLGGEAAAVVGLAVGPVALHAPLALGVEDASLEGVGVAGADFAAGGCRAA
ncbi:hypothetical protein [Streptomyces sp. NPDC046925]|uniref:hypothetical protein n=1 Tax=Streptomyces sp. NPDC046925 TaxID=3155375 RepID=UPI0033F1917B